MHFNTLSTRKQRPSADAPPSPSGPWRATARLLWNSAWSNSEPQNRRISNIECRRKEFYLFF